MTDRLYDNLFGDAPPEEPKDMGMSDEEVDNYQFALREHQIAEFDSLSKRSQCLIDAMETVITTNIAQVRSMAPDGTPDDLARYQPIYFNEVGAQRLIKLLTEHDPGLMLVVVTQLLVRQATTAALNNATEE